MEEEEEEEDDENAHNFSECVLRLSFTIEHIILWSWVYSMDTAKVINQT